MTERGELAYPMSTPPNNDNDLALYGATAAGATTIPTNPWSLFPDLGAQGIKTTPTEYAKRLAKLIGNHLRTITAYALAFVDQWQKGKREAIAYAKQATDAQAKEALARKVELEVQIDHTEPRQAIKGSLKLGALGLIGLVLIIAIIAGLWGIENLSGAMLLKESGVFGIDNLAKGAALLAMPLGLGLIFGKLVVPYTLGRKARRKFIIFSIIATVVLFSAWVWSFAGAAGDAMAQMAKLLTMESGGSGEMVGEDLQSPGATHPMVMFLTSVALMFFSSIVSQAGLLSYLGKFQSYEPNPEFQELEEELAVSLASLSSLQMAQSRIAQVIAQMDADKALIISEARAEYLANKTDFPNWPGLGMGDHAAA